MPHEARRAQSPRQRAAAGVQGEDGVAGEVVGAMPAGLSELFAMMEEELGVEIPNSGDAGQMTPGELIAHVLETVPDLGGVVSDAGRREYVETVFEELMEQVLGITRYDQESTFAEILRSARHR